MLFEFFAQVVHCDSLVSFLHLERRLIMMTLKLRKMMIVMIVIIMINHHDILLSPHFERAPLPAHTPGHCCQDGALITLDLAM